MTASTPIETLRLPERVFADIAGYRAGVARFQSGELNAVAFRAFRVPMGVYEHRQTGHYMVRVRLGAGLATPEQLEHIAQLSVRHGDGVLHVTTRQDIQIHDVSLDGTIAVQEGLLEAGLSADGGGGNTVRNVTACPRASVCPKGIFDVAPFALAVAEHLLQIPRSYNLPRKYKIAFSGCSEDCAFASVNDLGFFAKQRADQVGFTVYAGGGLGPQATAGVLVEEFILPEQVFLVAEAIERLFDRLGDRINRNRARLRYVLRRLGPDAFVAEYRKERAVLEREGLSAPVPAARPVSAPTSIAPDKPMQPAAAPASAPASSFVAERDPNRFTLRVQLQNGHIPAADLVRVGQIARRLGVGLVGATQQQDLLVFGIPADRLAEARAALLALGVESHQGRPKVVACAGASTCKLGLCLSPALADAITARLHGLDVEGKGPEVIRASGCPNACGNHIIAGLGFEGRARHHRERLLPLYDVLVGGKLSEGDVRFAERLGAVPARVVPDLVADIYSQNLTSADEIRPVVDRYARLPDQVPESYYIDYGSTQPSSLAGRGPGECGAGVLDIIQADLEEAKDALAAGERDGSGDPSASIHRAIVAAARALLPLFGIDARKERQVFQAATEDLIAPGWVSQDTAGLFAAAIDWRLGDRSSLEDCRAQARGFDQRVRELFTSLDGSLRFHLPPLMDQRPPGPGTPASKSALIDLRGVACPMNFVKAKVALERLAVGDVLDVFLDDGDPVRNVPGSFSDQGQEVVAVSPEGTHFRVSVRRKR